MGEKEKRKMQSMCVHDRGEEGTPALEGCVESRQACSGCSPPRWLGPTCLLSTLRLLPRTYVHVFYVCVFSPPSPPHCTPGIFPGMQCGGGGAWSARTRHGTLRRCMRVWKAARLVAVGPRRVGAVPGSAGFSIPHSIFFFRVGVTYFDS